MLKLILLFFILAFIYVGFCQRRIVKGVRTHGQKRYMVYMIKSRESTDPYDSWLCGGALVTTSQILTSAACIVDIDNIYAIAGYRKYVNGRDIDTDNCTRLKKQRVVKIRVPQEHIAHAKDYSNSTQWMSLDIGVATVEKPYDFEDISFKIHCSYIPAAIQINYNPNLDKKLETNVVALGWGRDKGSKVSDVVDRNSETLREVSIKIKDKDHCINKFQGNGLTEMIEKYMICAHGRGLLDGEGYVVEDNVGKRTDSKCIDDETHALNTGDMIDCIDDFDYFGIRRRSKKSKNGVVNNTIRVDRNESIQMENATNVRRAPRTRRQGICENDHGGPLITWVGSTELLIGVAVNSLYDANFECIGPFLFTSTSAAGQIVRCLLSTENQSSPSRKSCGESETEGYDIFEKDYKTAPGGLISRSNIKLPSIPIPMTNDNESLSSIEVVII